MRRSRSNAPSRALVRLGCVLLGCLLAALPLPAQTLSEYDVEAAYLYNFGKFVRWPADAQKSSPEFDICILGHDPFGGTLDRLIANDRVDGRPIHKRIITRPASAKGCAIVYIADSEARHMHAVLETMANQQTLLVSGLPHFLENGGMIQFVLNGDRVRFAVNLDAAARCHLALSSDLLKVALSVTGKPRNGGSI